MAGGDGSQALVATVAMRHDVAHVCVPAGTRNHFALDLGLDRNDVVGALDAFTDGVERRIDLASLNERIFVNNASLGVYARVVQSDEYRDAKLATWKRMLPDMVGQDTARRHASLRHAAQRRTGATQRWSSSRTTRIRCAAFEARAHVRISTPDSSASSWHSSAAPGGSPSS